MNIQAIELLMTSKFNVERRRERRAKEGSEFEKVQLLKGLMDQEVCSLTEFLFD